MYGSMMAIGGLAATTALYMNQNQQNNIAEASEGKNEVVIPFASKL